MWIWTYNSSSVLWFLRICDAAERATIIVKAYKRFPLRGVPKHLEASSRALRVRAEKTWAFRHCNLKLYTFGPKSDLKWIYNASRNSFDIRFDLITQLQIRVLNMEGWFATALSPLTWNLEARTRTGRAWTSLNSRVETPTCGTNLTSHSEYTQNSGT